MVKTGTSPDPQNLLLLFNTCIKKQKQYNGLRITTLFNLLTKLWSGMCICNQLINIVPLKNHISHPYNIPIL